MNRLELLAPAGSYEAMVAAVQNGADAVYMGFGDFNARRGAKNLTVDEMRDAVEYCRVRGVKTHITLNTLLSDRELCSAEDIVKQINRIGADAVIVADWGLARLIHQVAPEIVLHASTQQTIHSLEGVKYAKKHGFSRVVLSRELSREQIEYICKNTDVEIEVFAHGALCMCYSGQCYLSAVIGSRSGNRGLCAQPCRLPYKLNSDGKNAYPLSLKDLCLAENLRELEEMGVKCVKIEGRMKRPEYVATVTGIYSKLIREKRDITQDEYALLEKIFSRQGFTKGYYLNKKGADMFGVRAEKADADISDIYKTARESYNGETPRTDIEFECTIKKGESAKVIARDSDGFEHVAYGDTVEEAVNRPITLDDISSALKKTGGTQYRCISVCAEIDDFVAISKSALNAMRRECIEEINKKRAEYTRSTEGKYTPCKKIENTTQPPAVSVSVASLSQLTEKILKETPEIVYFPLECIKTQSQRIAELSEDVKMSAVIPRIILDTEREPIRQMLMLAKECGVESALIGNVAQFSPVRECGLDIRCDFGFNVFNSETLDIIAKEGAKSAVISPELTFPQVRDISKPIPTELIVYGRMPLMITENCFIKSHSGKCTCDKDAYLIDRTGAKFPIMRDFEHRNTLLNSQVIFLADKKKDYSNLGLWAVRLNFTTEIPDECERIFFAYAQESGYIPESYTRGLYRRGVE